MSRTNPLGQPKPAQATRVGRDDEPCPPEQRGAAVPEKKTGWGPRANTFARSALKQALGIRGAMHIPTRATLAKASPAELNRLIGSLEHVDVHASLATPGALELIKGRIGDLTLDSRIKVIQSLHQGLTTRADAEVMRDIFVATKGSDLTALKNGLERNVTDYDLHQLVFTDIADPGIRKQILDHFKAEAKPTGQLKVVSDIDDTFYANLKDDRYPGRTVYPGVRAFLAELDRGAGKQPDREGDITFLSARPTDAAGICETLTREMLQSRGMKSPTVITGDWKNLIGNERIAEKKIENWRQMRELFPEYGNVLIGDSGQGDAILGARAVADAPSQVKGSFIHNVTAMDAGTKAELAKKGVHVFETYLGAAGEAYRRGLISREGLGRIAYAARAELEAVKFDSPEQKAARFADFERDLAAAGLK